MKQSHGASYLRESIEAGGVPSLVEIFVVRVAPGIFQLSDTGPSDAWLVEISPGILQFDDTVSEGDARIVLIKGVAHVY